MAYAETDPGFEDKRSDSRRGAENAEEELKWIFLGGLCALARGNPDSNQSMHQTTYAALRPLVMVALCGRLYSVCDGCAPKAGRRRAGLATEGADEIFVVPKPAGARHGRNLLLRMRQQFDRSTDSRFQQNIERTFTARFTKGAKKRGAADPERLGNLIDADPGVEQCFHHCAGLSRQMGVVAPDPCAGRRLGAGHRRQFIEPADNSVHVLRSPLGISFYHLCKEALNSFRFRRSDHLSGC